MNGLDDATVVQRQIGGGDDGGASTRYGDGAGIGDINGAVGFNTSDPPLTIEPVPKLFTVAGHPQRLQCCWPEWRRHW